MLRQGIRLKNRWGQPRVGPILTFGHHLPIADLELWNVIAGISGFDD